MTVKNLLKSAYQIESLFNENAGLISYLLKVSTYQSSYVGYYSSLKKSYVKNSPSETYQEMTKVVGVTNKTEKEILDIIRSYKPYNFGKEIETLKNSLKNNIVTHDIILDSFDENTENLIEIHTEAYSEKTSKDIMSFVFISDSFYQKLKSIQSTARMLIENLQTEPISISENNDIIDIQIVNGNNNLEKFTAFLNSIDSLYQGLCKVYFINYSDQPLSIIKIESGSTWTKLFGEKHLIQFIKDLFFGLGNYIRDVQTGKLELEKFEFEVEKANLVANLIAKTNELGIANENTLLLQKTLNQAISNISKSLPKTTTEIFIDEKPLLKLNKSEQKALLGKETLMLKGKEENNEELGLK